MKRWVWFLLPLVFFVSLVVIFSRGLQLDPHHLPSAKKDKPLPDFTLPTLSNQSMQTKDLQGKVFLLNVWASWCAACVEEHPFLLKIARKKIPLYGLNYKDQPEDAKLWLKMYGNPYQAIMSDQKGRLAIDLGVYGAPETFVIDQKSIIRHRHVGILTEAIWKQEIEPLLKTLEVSS